jgi:hypothetical protein
LAAILNKVDEPIIRTKEVTVSHSEAVSCNMFLHRGKYLRSAGIFVVIGALILALSLALDRSTLIVAAIVAFLSALLIPLYYWIWFVRFWKNPKNARLLAPARAEIWDDALVIKSRNGGESKIPWSDFIAFNPWLSHIILMFSEYQGVVMFDHAFEEGDWSRFLELIEAKIPH